MSAEDLPQADQVEGAPHPRHTARLFGQAAAEAEFLHAVSGERLHHAWLITGPRGVGKATLAWRIARFLLSEGTAGDPVEPALAGGALAARTAPASLDVPAETATARRVAALSEPRLYLLRRGWDADRKRLKSVITVDEVRRLKRFFGLSAADGGRRVVLVDAVDEMNVNAANALLKLLEEPPAQSVLLLVSHQPARLLPTIRSRCRPLRCNPLGPQDMADALAGAGSGPGADAAALAALSGGSVGEALRLVHGDGLAQYAELVALLGTMPRLDRPRALRLADSAAGRGAEERLGMLIGLIDLILARLAHAGAGSAPTIEAAPGEAALLSRLAPDAAAGRRWAALHQELGARLRHGRAVNLDPSALILDTVLRINEAVAGPGAEPPR